jgi:hypothetical protein
MGSGDGVLQSASLDWCRSSLCQAGECVEVAANDDVVVMRSSVHPDADYVYLGREEFGVFLAEVKAGEFALFQ